MKELTGITKTRLFKYIENFTTQNWKFSDKNSDISCLFKYIENFTTQNWKFSDKNSDISCLFKYIENFTTKNWKFSDKNSDIFHISAQNIDCGYSLEQK